VLATIARPWRQVQRKVRSAELLDATVEEALRLLENIPQIKPKLKTPAGCRAGYIKLGQSATTLSGGEAQRIKLAKELSKRATGRTIYILDEPTTGLHLPTCISCSTCSAPGEFGQHSEIVIEHNLDVIKSADFIIDLGPGRRRAWRTIGGQRLRPKKLPPCGARVRGRVLKPLLNGNGKRKRYEEGNTRRPRHSERRIKESCVIYSAGRQQRT